MFLFLLLIFNSFYFVLQREELEAALAEERARSERESSRLASLAAEVNFNFFICFLAF